MISVGMQSEMIAFGQFMDAVQEAADGQWSPYPWQERFAQRCADPEETPPSWVVVPTGAGKTTVVDVLVWALAAQADLAPAERTASTRIVWAIDRRILVDEVFEHAQRLADRFESALDAPGDPLYAMAYRLLGLAAGGEELDLTDPRQRETAGLRPLAVARWRGGLATRDNLLSPFQPQVITSTVGQVGSRLFFRGYGVGRKSLALSAGLVSTDTTVCLDEAHLAVPFRETVDAIRARREGDQLNAPGLRLVTLTATPPPDYDRASAIGLSTADHARLGKRWTGTKTLELREPTGKVVQELSAATLELLDEGRSVVACVVNRVRTARAVHGALRAKLESEADVLLLMGPQRPADRQQQLDKAHAALFEGVNPGKPLVVVATQTIEVGLDADFAGMVTQSASASALIQRLGRLNRSGNRPGRCIVIRDRDSSLYTDDEEAAWCWLSSPEGAPAGVDVSVKAITEDDRVPPDHRQPIAATLTDSILTQLRQTSPPPAPLAEPDIDPLISGIGSKATADVQIVWRCDLRFDEEPRSGDEVDLDAYRRAVLELAPPQPSECLSLGVRAAKKLLRELISDRNASPSLLEEADIEGGHIDLDERTGPVSPNFVVLRGREILLGSAEPTDDEQRVALAELEPGDMIVVPTSVGGVDKFGLTNVRSSEATDTCPDLLPPPNDPTPRDLIPIRLSRETMLARHPESKQDAGDDYTERRVRESWEPLARALENHTLDKNGSVNEATLSSDALTELIEKNAGLDAISRWLAAAPPEYVWRMRRVDPIRPDTLEDEDGPEAADLRDRAWVLQLVLVEHDDDTSVREAPPTIESHSKAVRRKVSQYAGWLSLPAPERCALELAALAHDLGKCDPRFQDFLAGGVSSIGSAPLAKSVFGERNPSASRLAVNLAGLPSRFRHEARSVAILDTALARGTIPDGLQAADSSLALLLVGTHHGLGQPLWPLEQRGRPPERFEAGHRGISGFADGTNADGWLDGRWIQLFFDLCESYGPWTLAYLQALFMLADRVVSRGGE